MGFVQYGHQTEAERAAAERQRERMQIVKEIGEWQAVIVCQLEQLIRGAPPDRIRARISEASEEYGVRLRALLGPEPYRLTGPTRR
jgi:hypothetical protein